MSHPISPKVMPPILHHLQTLPDGTSLTMAELLAAVFGPMQYADGVYTFGDLQLSDLVLCDLDRIIRSEARYEGMLLDDSAHAGEAVGMPFHCPFTLRRTKTLWRERRQK